MLIKILILVFIVYVLSRIYLRYKKQDINGREFFVWLSFWVIVGVVTMMPQKTDVVANFLGVERGADLLIYISILVIFYLVFRIMVRLEKFDHDLTKIIRHLAISDADENDSCNKDKLKD